MTGNTHVHLLEGETHIQKSHRQDLFAMVLNGNENDRHLRFVDGHLQESMMTENVLHLEKVIYHHQHGLENLHQEGIIPTVEGMNENDRLLEEDRLSEGGQQNGDMIENHLIKGISVVRISKLWISRVSLPQKIHPRK